MQFPRNRPFVLKDLYPYAQAIGKAGLATARRVPRTRASRGALTSTRLRLVVSYVLLLAVAGVASSMALREVLHIRLEDRVRGQLAQEVSELDRLLDQGRDPRTGRPFGSDLRTAFESYFGRNVPSEEEGTATFVEGRPHRAVLSRYPLPRLPASKVREWARLSRSSTAGREPLSGTYETSLGKAHYTVLPVRAGRTSGVFVVSLLPAGELREIGDLQRSGFTITLGVVLLATLLGWFAARRVLEPLRLLTDTARLISRSELRRRVPVVGSDEGAEMARTFNAMLDRLEAVFEGQRKFLRDASHELRAPLSICIGQLDVLSNDRRAEHGRTVELVIDELQRAGDIVHQLRVLAESELPAFVRPEPVDLGSLSQELVDKASALAPRKWELREAGEGTVLADRHRLTEAVMNVAENAVHQTSEGDLIALGTSATNGDVRLWVHDTGPGVGAADRQRIFEPFERGRHAIRRYRGAGLGLAIVRAIAEAHGGRVEFDSVPGRGTTFTIVVPRRETGSEAATGAEARA
jgi:two-component system, OmpR family, sensor kinase